MQGPPTKAMATLGTKARKTSSHADSRSSKIRFNKLPVDALLKIVCSMPGRIYRKSYVEIGYESHLSRVNDPGFAALFRQGMLPAPPKPPPRPVLDLLLSWGTAKGMVFALVARRPDFAPVFIGTFFPEWSEKVAKSKDKEGAATNFLRRMAGPNRCEDCAKYTPSKCPFTGRPECAHCRALKPTKMYKLEAARSIWSDTDLAKYFDMGIQHNKVQYRLKPSIVLQDALRARMKAPLWVAPSIGGMESAEDVRGLFVGDALARAKGILTAIRTRNEDICRSFVKEDLRKLRHKGKSWLDTLIYFSQRQCLQCLRVTTAGCCYYGCKMCTHCHKASCGTVTRRNVTPEFGLHFYSIPLRQPRNFQYCRKQLTVLAADGYGVPEEDISSAVERLRSFPAMRARKRKIELAAKKETKRRRVV